MGVVASTAESRIVKVRLVIDETRECYTHVPDGGKALTHWSNLGLAL